MDQARVNLTLDREVWEKFAQMVPKREKSKIINDLLKKEIKKIERNYEQQAMAAAFREASKDSERQAAIREWDFMDVDGWGER